MRIGLRSGVMLAVLIGSPALGQDAETLRVPPLVEAPAETPVETPVVAPVVAPVARVANPDRIGYAFSDPPILLRQRLIGLAHGLRLLGRTCLLDPEFSLAAEQAYAARFARQGPAIEVMSLDLERWYFGNSVPEPNPAARMRDVVRLLGLRTELRPLGADEQRAACASYAQAIAGPRYDFVALLEETARELAGKAEPAPSELVEASVALPETSAAEADVVATDAVEAADATLVGAGSVQAGRGETEAGAVESGVAEPVVQPVASPEERRELPVMAAQPATEPLGELDIASPPIFVEATHE